MAGSSQRRASAMHRRRNSARGLVRVEIQAKKADAGLIRAVAERLRSGLPEAQALRSTLERVLGDQSAQNALDVFGSDLPDKVFEDVFGEERSSLWRESEL